MLINRIYPWTFSRKYKSKRPVGFFHPAINLSGNSMSCKILLSMFKAELTFYGNLSSNFKQSLDSVFLHMVTIKYIIVGT